RGRGAAERGRRGFRGAPAAAELPDGQPVPRDAPAHRLTGARGQGAAHEAPRPADHAPLPPQHPRLHAHGELHRPPAEDGGADEAALHRGSGQAHLRLHARHAPGDQQPLRRGAPRRVLEAGEGGRREDHRRGDQGHGGCLTMVRMSDLVRGAPAEKAAPPKTAPPKEPTEKRAAAPAVPPTLPRTRLAEGPLQSVAAPPRREPEPAPAPETPAPSPPPPPAPTAAPATVPAVSAEALFGGLLRFLAGVRDLVMTGSVTFPWDGLERLMGHAIGSLERSGELFWVANNPAAPADVDYLAFHQAQVAVLSMRIGADVGYDRRRLVALGMAGCLIDVGLWQLPESVLRRLDALTSAE